MQDILEILAKMIAMDPEMDPSQDIDDGGL
jgi:hypothetical protein